MIPSNIAAIVSLLLAAALPSTGSSLHPTKPWVLEYADAQCIASRDYGDLTFGVRPAPNGETYELLVLDKRPGPYYAAEFKGGVDFGQGPMDAWGLVYRTESSKSRIYQFRISAAEMQQARSAAAVRLSASDQFNQTFALESMPQLLEGFEKCTDNLKHYWNMTPDEEGKFAQHAKGTIRNIFSSRDYPSDAMFNGQEGTGQFLLLVNEKGRVAGCHVLTASGAPALDVQGCYVIMERARFKPARDVSGKPIRDAVTTPPITWRLAP